MSTVRNFYDLKVWQHSHEPTVNIYKVTKNFPKEEIFGLIGQMRRSASSVPANIAEGFGRFHFKEKIKFYQQARGSIAELQNHLFLSRDLAHLSKDKIDSLFEKATLVLKELNGLINSMRRQIKDS